LGEICEMTFIQHAHILEWLQYQNSDLQVWKGTIFATFYAILVKIGPLTPEITQGVSVPLGRDAKIDISYLVSQQVLDQTSLTFHHW